MRKNTNGILTPSDYAEEGYEVRPASNGGFVIFYGGKKGDGFGVLQPAYAAVSNPTDLLTFIAEAHGISVSINEETKA